MDADTRTRAILEDLTAVSERRWGSERTRELAGAIETLAETLALVASVDLGFDDAEPDFIGCG